MLSYTFNEKHTVVIGNGYEPFSMDNLISTASRCFLQSATSTQAYADSRKLGITWHVHLPHYYLATGFYTHNDVNTLGKEQRNAWISTSRAVWHRTHPRNPHSLIQAGGAFSFSSREKNTDKASVGSISSDGVTTLFDMPIVEISIPHMGTEVKGLLELFCLTPRLLFQAEYYADRINRTGCRKAFRTHGGYALCGFLLKGRHFEYDVRSAVSGRPLSPQALLLTARLDYMDANDPKAGIYGGRITNLTLGVSYYLNRYFGIKLNGSYVWTDQHCNDFYRKDLFLVQTRVQYIF